MLHRTEDLVSAWMADEDHGRAIEEASVVVKYAAKHLFDDYEPCQFDGFHSRLDHWLNNVDTPNDQRLLYQLIPHIFFIGRKEFDALHRSAFRHHIGTWLVARTNIRLGDSDSEQKLRDAVERTWFCPITDSMRINAFHHVNTIKGHEYRPDWLSMSKFGSVNRIENYINKKKIGGLVLLEDFVATGTQIAPIIKFAAGLQSAKLPIIVVPLVICPEGVSRLEKICSNHSNVTFSPVLQLPEQAFVRPTKQPNEPALYSKFRRLVRKTHEKVFDISSVDLRLAFGYGQTGSLIVMYSNCPDNTLPLIHRMSATWEPLFPRSARV